MTAGRTLTERELNRALLARQLLLERASSPIPKAIERIGGLQTQYAPSAYIGLWSRVDGFGRDDLTRALERRWVDPGHADARDDPHDLRTRLLADDRGDPASSSRIVAAGRRVAGSSNAR